MLTSDNPRHENPEAIIAEIRGGLKNPDRARVQPNRSQAIQDIIQSASSGDYVLVAGKGAETYQQIGDEKLPFSDARRIEEVLEV
jgi:UDP-N-acetylmuramoyl-L-alanyl-D-glutamate--2,6-diaminopimelate ligase